LLDPIFTKGLYERILLPLRDDIHGGALSLQSDKVDIAEALSVSGLQIVQTVITDQQEAATWFTSKWAGKVVNSMSKSLG
jgi:flagellar biosynthesis/type III secretory pathway ATPase